ncbi:hypothetical protein [Lysinibacillus sp. 3P01SB]|uniref:hypothetical protein n=1 Tax=Lysinibacillus sp. 3P01SB TaxID=3132284 RepID=UPI0039A54620
MAGDYRDYDYVEAGTVDVKDLKPLDPQIRGIMKGELSTGLVLTIVYFVFIFSIPIMNWFLPDLAFSKFWGGMTFTWFVTTVVAMIMAVVIAGIHTFLYERRLVKYEDEIIKYEHSKQPSDNKVVE